MTKTIFGLAIACLACCALPFLLPAGLGLAVFGSTLFVGGIGWETILCGGAFALLIGLVAWMMVKKAAKRPNQVAHDKATCHSSGDCGCK